GSMATDGTYTFAKGFILPDIGASPTVAGEFLRNGRRLEFHNSLAANALPLVVDKDNTPVAAANTTGPTIFYQKQLRAYLVGTSGRLRWTGIGSFNILNGSNVVALHAAWTGIGDILSHSIFGGTTSPRTNFAWRWIVEIYMNGAANSWRAIGEIQI